MSGSFLTWGFFLAVVASFLKIAIPVESPESCPKFCVCDTWYKLQRASCTGRHLYSIHTNAPKNIEALDLSNNSISSLNNYEFASVGLTRLKYLNLSENSINQIDLSAFGRLPNLTIVDLSRNHLYYVLEYLFVDNKSLRILKLSRNNFNTHVPKLRCPWLTELWLDSCQISHLPMDTFNGLSRIRSVDLSNNLMIQIESSLVQTLRFLRKLSLDGNPWSCNRNMYDLQIYLRRSNVAFNTVCGKASKMFEKLIIRPSTGQENHRPCVIPPKNTERSFSTSDVSHSPDEASVSKVNLKTNSTDLIKSLDGLSQYWFLIMGFILGSASSVIISYICLSGKFSCRRWCRERTNNDDSQRLSLLSNLRYFQDLALGNNADLGVSCPGTPPPPYREVMLRPGLYRRPSTTSNLNDNNQV